jgi:hypothetical protein
MSQTIGAMSGVNAHVEVSADGLVWHDVSGTMNQVGAVEQRRMSGEAYTFAGDTAIIKPGKREPIELTTRAIYTQIAGEAWQRTRAFFEAVGGNPIWLRWAPEPGIGMPVFRAEEAIVTRFQYADPAADEAGPLATEFAFRCPHVVAGFEGGAPLAERMALAALYAELGGAGWTDDTNWLTAADVGSWFGVTTQGDRVIAIDLEANGVSDGLLPAGWASPFTRLLLFSLRENALAAGTVDAAGDAFYQSRMRFQDQGMVLDLGGNNAAPGTPVQAPAPCPAATAGERLYELAFDTCGDGHHTWTVIYDGNTTIP